MKIFVKPDGYFSISNSYRTVPGEVVLLEHRDHRNVRRAFNIFKACFYTLKGDNGENYDAIVQAKHRILVGNVFKILYSKSLDEDATIELLFKEIPKLKTIINRLLKEGISISIKNIIRELIFSSKEMGYNTKGVISYIRPSEESISDLSLTGSVEVDVIKFLDYFDLKKEVSKDLIRIISKSNNPTFTISKNEDGLTIVNNINSPNKTISNELDGISQFALDSYIEIFYSALYDIDTKFKSQVNDENIYGVCRNLINYRVY